MLKKIVFMGTPFFAVPILKSLYQNGYPISVVYTQPPQKSKRGQKINKSPIQGISETLNIDYRVPTSLKNNKDEYEYFKNLDADIVIVVAYGQIIPKEFLSLTKKGFINIHASLLPKWRGAAPIQRSIMNLEKQTGISIMKIQEKLDSGPVCNSYKIEISNKDNSEMISDRLSSLAAEKILDNIDDILENKIKFKEQNHNEATYASKIEKSEGQIKWSETAEKIIGKINGLYKNPGAFFIYKGERYKILRAEITNGRGEIGDVLDDYLEISCGNKKSIKILEIQRQGKRPQSISEFMLGSQIKKGSNLNNV
ncbi:methionyl-tRNA formyltransferase [Candidatus Pelagibacter sp.]|nr:methionyl-tRNA formyltransferase [Candidatus Pelagibacter sp.]